MLDWVTQQEKNSIKLSINAEPKTLQKGETKNEKMK